MQHTMVPRGVALPALLLVAALATIGTTSSTVASGEPGRLALDGLDPVLLIAGEKSPGRESLALDHEGFRYHFAGPESLKRFENAPQRYAIQLDGQCAAMPHAAGDPEIFAVHAGKIYIFGGPGCRAEFLAEPARFLERKARMKVAILVYPGVELLDFAGPGEVFAAAGHGRAFEVYTVAESAAPIVSQGFVRVVPGYSIEDVPKPDILVVPGGGVGSVLRSAATLEWIRRTAADGRVLSVCNGALVLAELGLLDGLEATTHHGSLAALRAASPKITVHDGVRFVDNGRILTAAGVSAGIDGALHMVDSLLGRQSARGVARYMEYDWRPGAGKTVRDATTPFPAGD